MPSAPFLYEVASHVKNCHSAIIIIRSTVLLTYRACLAADTSLCCSLVSYETPLNFCMVSLMLARTGMDKIYTKRWFSVIHFPLVSPSCVFILLISTFSVIMSGDNPAQNMSLRLTTWYPSMNFRCASG